MVHLDDGQVFADIVWYSPERVRITNFGVRGDGMFTVELPESGRRHFSGSDCEFCGEEQDDD